MMTDKHSIEAVVERCSAAYHNAMGKFGIATPITCALSALQPGDRLPGGNVVVSLEPTGEQLQAAHDGPLMADEEHMDDKVRAWLREMYRAMIGATP